MSNINQENWSMFEGTQAMRDGLLDDLTDADLAFSPGGQNVTLGALFKEIGEVEYSYLQSLTTFKQDWSYRNEEAGIEGSVERLREWFKRQEAELKTRVMAMTDEDFAKTVDRDFAMPMDWQFQAYLQALLIFLGKATVYFKAMNKPLSKQIQDWIG